MSVIETFMSILSTIWNLFTNTITGITTFFNVLINSIMVPTQFVSVLPSFLSASVMAVVSIAVIKLIIGWGNS